MLEVTIAGDPIRSPMVLICKELKRSSDREITQRMDHRFREFELRLKIRFPLVKMSRA